MSKYSEALKQLRDISYFIMEAYSDHEPPKENQRDSRQCFMDSCKNIRQALLKAQEQEKELTEYKKALASSKKLEDKINEIYQGYTDKEFELLMENKILKDGVKTLNLSLGHDEGNKCRGDLNGYCVAIITPQKEMFVLLSEVGDDPKVVERYNKIKAMLEVVGNE